MADKYIIKENEMKDLVRSEINFLEQNKGSVLTRAGATPLTRTPSKFATLSTGGAQALVEGGSKKIAEKKKTDIIPSKFKLVYAMIFSSEALREEGAESFVKAQINRAARGIVKSYDIAVLHGTSARDGSKLDEAYKNAIAPHAVKSVATSGEHYSAIREALLKDTRGNAVILSDGGAYAVTSATVGKDNNLPLHATFDLNNDNSVLFSKRALYAPHAGLLGWTPESETKSNLLALSGDFSNIYRSISDFDIHYYDQATIDGENLAENNKVCYMIEAFCDYVNVAPTKFNAVYDENDAVSL